MRIKPSHLFCTGKEVCTPIRILDVKGFRAWRQDADVAAAAQAKTFGFMGYDTQLAYINNKDGTLKEVLFGTNLQRLPSHMRGLATRLPEGAFEFQFEMAPPIANLVALFWALGQYNFDQYKSKRNARPRSLKLPAGANKKRVEELATSLYLARDLINTPPNDMGPDGLEAAALGIAKSYSAKATVIRGDDLLKKGFPAIHAVGKAAAQAPRLIDLVWGDEKHPRVTLVGKGVCFDTGGLDIKSATGMILMKKDMGGAAVALGLARAIMALNLPIRLRVLIPAVENSISGNAYRPSDVIATRKGITVEIGNTDAEGRVVLCDALALADEERPDLLIDFATLTGAARTALGPDLGALFANNDELATGLMAGGMNSGDPLWRMPLWQPYRETLKSEVADINNMADTTFAGAITAALYLQSFIEHTKSWAHLDVYCWNTKQKPGRPKGAEAHGLLAAFSYLESRFGK